MGSFARVLGDGYAEVEGEGVEVREREKEKRSVNPAVPSPPRYSPRSGRRRKQDNWIRAL